MFRLWKLTLFFVLCLALSLLANMPAVLVLPQLHLDPALRLSGVNGSILRGRVERADYEALTLERVDYRLQPECLLTLDLCYRFDASEGGLRYAWNMLSGDAVLSDARLALAADRLAANLAPLPVALTGQIEVELTELKLVDGRPAGLTGNLLWRGLGADDGGSPLRLGDYRAEVSGDEQGYRAEITTLAADLMIEGEASLRADGEYEVDLEIESEAVIDPRAKTLLELFARGSGYNQYRVSRQGRLPPTQLRQLFPSS